MNSEAGLLLCSRGRLHPAHLYVCNPMTRQWVALPELRPWPALDEWLSSLLTVDTDDSDKLIKRFQVVLFNHPVHWEKEGGCFDLRLFSSDKGRWERIRLQSPALAHPFYSRSRCGWSGTAYWPSPNVNGPALAYNSTDHSLRMLPLPYYGGGVDDKCSPPWNQIIGECKGGGLQLARFFNSSVLEVWNKEDGNAVWLLVHSISVVDLLGLNQELEAFLCSKVFNWEKRFKLLAFHPTDQGVIFLSIHTNVVSRLLGVVLAYSIQHGTLSLQCTQRSTDSSEIFPYVHPPYPRQIPAINNS